MPAASYREGPDGHSSRKQNSKRRRAKCSPSFVSGRVIGHGDISPHCIPECSAMALHRAVPAARSSRASTLSFVLLAGAFSKSCLRRRFFAGRAAVIWCGANPGVRPWQDLRECALGRLAVAIFSRDAFSGVLPMAKCSRNAFPSVRRRQDCALMRSWPDWQWQYSRAMRSRVSIRGNIPPRCVPGRPSVTIFSPHASQKRPRTGKSPVRGKIRAPCIRKRAPFGKICAPCIRKSPANRLSGTHGAKILPGRSPFRCTGPSNHARRADLAVRRSVKPPERPQHRCRRTARAAKARSHDPRNTAQGAAPPSSPGQQVPPAAPAVPPPLFANTSQ